AYCHSPNFMLSSHTVANHKIKPREKELPMKLHSSTRALAMATAILALLSLSGVVSAQKKSTQDKGQQQPTMSKTFVYPPAKKVDQIDDYHAVKVADPYPWLEDPGSAESPA